MPVLELYAVFDTCVWTLGNLCFNPAFDSLFVSTRIVFQSSSCTCKPACMIADRSVAWIQGRSCEDIHCASTAGDSLIDRGSFGANMLNWHHQRSGFQSTACTQTGKKVWVCVPKLLYIDLYHYGCLVGCPSLSKQSALFGGPHALILDFSREKYLNGPKYVFQYWWEYRGLGQKELGVMPFK